MKKVIGFGDFLVRLSPQGYLKFIQADSFDVNYTGAEANVLVSLACMGVDTEFVTRVPDNAIADSGIAMMRKFNVGTRHIVKGGDHGFGPRMQQEAIQAAADFICTDK